MFKNKLPSIQVRQTALTWPMTLTFNSPVSWGHDLLTCTPDQRLIGSEDRVNGGDCITNLANAVGNEVFTNEWSKITKISSSCKSYGNVSYWGINHLWYHMDKNDMANRWHIERKVTCKMTLTLAENTKYQTLLTIIYWYIHHSTFLLILLHEVIHIVDIRDWDNLDIDNVNKSCRCGQIFPKCCIYHKWMAPI